MDCDLIIAIGGFILAALTYFAGVNWAERRYKRLEKVNRIDGVVNLFFSTYKKDGVVIELLIPSGINLFIPVP